MSEEWPIVGSYDNPIHADLAKVCLEAAGIPHFLDNANIVQMDWLLSNAVGNIRVQVPPEFAEEAWQLLQDMKPDPAEASTAADDDGCLACGEPMPDDIDTCPACGWSFTDVPDEGNDAGRL